MASVVWGRAFDGAGPAEVNGFGGLGSLIVFYTRSDVSILRGSSDRKYTEWGGATRWV